MTGRRSVDVLGVHLYLQLTGERDRVIGGAALGAVFGARRDELHMVTDVLGRQGDAAVADDCPEGQLGLRSVHVRQVADAGAATFTAPRDDLGSIRPDFVETQTGYMQGAAGIGSFLLHLATVGDDTRSKIALPDSPFDR